MQLDPAKKKLSSSSSDIFQYLNDFEVKTDLIAEVIRLELMNLRQGNAHTKTRADVRGGGKKPWRQKGTGRARHGSIRSPLWVGGGVTFGPRNSRNWHRKINSSARKTALNSILADRLADSNLLLSDNLNVAKTKEAIELFSVLNQQNSKLKLAIVYTTPEKNSLNGFSNIENVDLINLSTLSVNRLANNHAFLFTENAAKELTSRLNK